MGGVVVPGIGIDGAAWRLLPGSATVWAHARPCPAHDSWPAHRRVAADCEGLRAHCRLHTRGRTRPARGREWRPGSDRPRPM